MHFQRNKLRRLPWTVDAENRAALDGDARRRLTRELTHPRLTANELYETFSNKQKAPTRVASGDLFGITGCDSREERNPERHHQARNRGRTLPAHDDGQGVDAPRPRCRHNPTRSNPRAPKGALGDAERKRSGKWLAERKKMLDDKTVMRLSGDVDNEEAQEAVRSGDLLDGE